METIQVQVSPNLAQRLRSHYHELPQILEWGLRHVEGEEQQLVSALNQVGATGPDPEVVVQYLQEQATEQWTPIPSEGKPASEMIVEERDSRPWSK